MAFFRFQDVLLKCSKSFQNILENPVTLGPGFIWKQEMIFDPGLGLSFSKDLSPL